MSKFYILLGSNIEPEKNIPLALGFLGTSPEWVLLSKSGIWRTKPIGSCCTDFLNVAVLVETPLSPNELKNRLAAIESAMGRVRTEDKNAPRVIDLDIVAEDERVIDKEISVFDHILLPLSEIAPNMLLPDSLTDLAEASAARKKFTAAVRVD